MVWFRLDDTLAYDARVTKAGNGAFGTWARAASWCSQHLTDGFVPHHVASGIAERKSQIANLVAAGLWLEVDGGYQFPDWQASQRTAASVRAEREKNAARKAEQRAREAVQQAHEAAQRARAAVESVGEVSAECGSNVGEASEKRSGFPEDLQVNEGGHGVTHRAPTHPNPAPFGGPGGGGARKGAREGADVGEPEKRARAALVERIAAAVGCSAAAASRGLARLEDDPGVHSASAVVESFLRDDRHAALAARLKIKKSKPTTRRPPPLPPPCGECDARPGDPPNARVVWLDATHTQSAPCPRCSPDRAGHAS
ncbi:hypothetical protein ACU61A_28515 [Pseudonocardia sichuanensis]